MPTFSSLTLRGAKGDGVIFLLFCLLIFAVISSVQALGEGFSKSPSPPGLGLGAALRGYPRGTFAVPIRFGNETLCVAKAAALYFFMALLLTFSPEMIRAGATYWRCG